MLVIKPNMIAALQVIKIHTEVSPTKGNIPSNAENS
jgi:hypothetical protein